jgi:hypothetical protein
VTVFRGMAVMAIDPGGQPRTARVVQDRGAEIEIELEGGERVSAARERVVMPDGSPLPQPRRWFARRLNRALVLVPFVFAAIGFWSVETVIALPLGFVFGLGIASAVLFAEWAMVRIAAALERAGKSSTTQRRFDGLRPALPFFERYGASPLPWLALGAVSLVVFGAREHLFGDTLSLGFEWFEGHADTDWHQSSSSRASGHDGDPPSLADYPVWCTASCRPAGAICDAAIEALACDGDRPASGPSTRVRLSIQHRGGGCSWLPLHTSSKLEFDVNGDLSVRDEYGTRSAHLDLDGTIDHSVWGFHSCWNEKRYLGAEIGRIAGNVTSDVIADN